MFTWRGLRNRAEIEKCVEMLTASPFWVTAYFNLSPDSVVSAWEKLLTDGLANLIVLEFRNRDSADHRKLKGSFPAYIFTPYITSKFIEEIVQHKEIPDVSMHLMKSLVEHITNPALPTPIISPEEFQRATWSRPNPEIDERSVKPQCGLYMFSTLVHHPVFEVSDLVRYSFSYTERTRENMNLMHGGLPIYALFTNVNSKLLRFGIETFGATLLREYAENKTTTKSLNKRFIFCCTKNAKISESLLIPGVVEKVMSNRRVGNNYRAVLKGADKQPIAIFSDNIHRQICYLIALNFTPAQIANHLGLSSRCTAYTSDCRL